MPTKPDKSRRELSIEQLNALDLLVVGKTDREVAEAVGVTRPTVTDWRNHHPGFAAALNAHREALWGESADRLRGLLPAALTVLEKALAADDPDPKTALAILRATGLAGLDLGTYGVGATDADRWQRKEEARRREQSFLDMVEADRF